MKVGITTYNFQNKDFREQLHSMLACGITPGFIIMHYGGIYKFTKAVDFFRKVLKQHRGKSISYLSSYRKNKPVPNSKYKLSAEAEKEVDDFLAKVKVINAKGINSSQAVASIKAIGETIIVCNSGKLNQQVLDIPTAIFLNIHASKLPEYRGMNNIEWALWHKKELYCTIHKISVGMDEGDILYQEKIDLTGGNLKDISSYREYCFYKSNQLIGKAIKGYLDKTLAFVPQKEHTTPLSQYYVMHPLLKEYLNRRLANS